jgi:DNA (cytosine-5)-methyltransferase 1
MQPRSSEAAEYQLENVRGSRLELPPHRSSCPIERLSEHVRELSGPLAVDLFCGAGGLSLGLERAGFNVVLGVDQDQFAIETHRAHFPGASVRADISDERVLDELLKPLRGRRIDLLSGGPPCQPFSKPARWIRSATSEGRGSLGDHRRELWVSFLYAAEVLRPRSILMENVTDVATSDDGIVLRSIFSRMEELGYSVDCRAYFARELGVAQHRQRLFVVGFRDGARLLDWPTALPISKQPNLRDAISDLPPLKGGWDEATPRYGGPRTDLQRKLRDGVANGQLFDHVTRAVRKDDLVAFRFMNDKTRYNHLPEELRRYDATNFTDKYNRLAWDEPSRAIAAHIARDGYWYIHPEQHRTLSIREAARIQSFPDWFRFAGFKTSAFKQIGEAVAPLVAEAIGRRILALIGPSSNPGRPSSRLVDKHLKVRAVLKLWYEKETKKNSLHPWRRETSLWLNLLGETLFSERSHAPKAPLFWTNFRSDWPDPRTYLKDKHRLSHLKTLGMEEHLAALDATAQHLAAKKISSVRELTSIGLTERTVRRALAVTGFSNERPDDVNLIRVANRIFERGTPLKKLRVESQITTALLVGRDDGAVLYAAAIELGKSICTESEPACMLCPLGKHCSHLGRE